MRKCPRKTLDGLILATEGLIRALRDRIEYGPTEERFFDPALLFAVQEAERALRAARKLTK